MGISGAIMHGSQGTFFKCINKEATFAKCFGHVNTVYSTMYIINEVSTVEP